jgi:hypothetical protein
VRSNSADIEGAGSAMDGIGTVWLSAQKRVNRDG